MLTAKPVLTCLEKKDWPVYFYVEKSCILGILNLAASAVNSTNTDKKEEKNVRCIFKCLFKIFTYFWRGGWGGCRICHLFFIIVLLPKGSVTLQSLRWEVYIFFVSVLKLPGLDRQTDIHTKTYTQTLQLIDWIDPMGQFRENVGFVCKLKPFCPKSDRDSQQNAFRSYCWNRT